MAAMKATRRGDIGTRKARRLRDQGRIPGILYGHGQSPEAMSLDQHDLDLAIKHGERLLEIELEGKTENALIKEVQYDTFGQKVLHIDLARVNLDELVKVTVPVVLRGIPVGAEEGGVLHQVSAQVEIECMVRSIPDDIRVTVNHLKVGDVLHMSDLPLPEGTKLLSDANGIVCTVTVVAEEAVVAPVEEVPAAGEPEVIGAKKEEEAPAEGEAEPKKKEKEEK